MKNSKIIRAISVFVVLLSIVLCASGCNSTDINKTQDISATETQSSAEKRKIIIDTDTGADDAAALILAAKQKNVEILGVTVLVGNVNLEQSTENALAALEIAGCDAPVYKGSDKSFDGKKKTAYSVFGKDGLGDADIVHPKRKAESGNAIDFIINTVKENPNEVEIIATGPATNIARAIEKAPDTMKKVKRIWSLGTAGLGVGNASPVAEFNVYSDAPAYKKMLDSELPITVIGLDMCGGDAEWTDEQFKELEGLNEIGEFITKSFGKIREFYKKNGDANVMICDPIAVMCALYPDFITESINTHASCITDEGETYSEVVFYKEGFTYDIVKNDFNFTTSLITGIKKTEYFSNYINAIS